MNKVFAVFGNPILHSKSPDMFNSAFLALNEDSKYIRVAAKDPAEIKELILDIPIRGANITSPFKEDLLRIVNVLDPIAEKIGAINTIVNTLNIDELGVLKGYNTDYIGIIKSLENNSVELKNKKIIILGSGGAAKAAVYACISKNAKDVVLLNRTAEKAKKICDKLGCRFSKIENLGNEIKDADILISCISRGINLLKNLILNKNLVVLDANYPSSDMLEYAKSQGCKIINGSEWLLFQAERSFELFTFKSPPAKAMKDSLKNPKLKKSNIALIGFMGSGKSTVGKELSSKSGMELVDIDEEIEKTHSKSIKEIFETSGEDKFRELEQIEIEKIQNSKNKIFSCGGGSILNKKNREIIANNCLTVWLYSGIDETLKRLKNDKRPLLNTSNKLEKARNLLFERLSLYAETSDLLISSKTGSQKQIAERILYEIEKTK